MESVEYSAVRVSSTLSDFIKPSWDFAPPACDFSWRERERERESCQVFGGETVVNQDCISTTNAEKRERSGTKERAGILQHIEAPTNHDRERRRKIIRLSHKVRRTTYHWAQGVGGSSARCAGAEPLILRCLVSQPLLGAELC
jgi:hypothetical protein